MDRPRVSVIIPVKNKAAYIQKTVEDMLKQKESDLQLLFVDNASTDETADILRSFTDPRLVVLTEPKTGVSAARNRGLREALGKYVIFCDADDEVTESYVSDLYELMEAHPDITMGACGYETLLAEKGQAKKIKESPVEDLTQKDRQEMLLRLFSTKYYEGFIWNKIFRNDVIQKAQLFFDEDVFFNEDRLFLVSYLLTQKGDTLYLPAKNYRYFIREDSAMNAFREGEGVAEGEITEFLAFERMEEKLKNEDLPRVLYALREDMIQSELRCFKRMIAKDHIFRYRKSRMRYYAKKAVKVAYDPQGLYEDVLLRVMIRYGRTGCTYTRNPKLFSEIGIL